MSDSAESIRQAVRKGVKAGRGMSGTGLLSSDLVQSIESVTPDIEDCRVCEEPVFEYEVCYDCEQQYYPPRQYWQEVAA